MLELIYDMETGSLKSQYRWNELYVSTGSIFRDTVVVNPDAKGAGSASGQVGLFFDRLKVTAPENITYSSYPYVINDKIQPYFSPFNSRANDKEVIIIATQNFSDITGLKAELANVFIIYNTQTSTLRIVSRSDLAEADIKYINDHFGTLPWFRCPGDGEFNITFYFDYNISIYAGNCINVKWSASVGWIVCGQNSPASGQLATTSNSDSNMNYGSNGEIVRCAISDTTGLENSIRTLQVQTEELYHDMVKLADQLTQASKFFITR